MAELHPGFAFTGSLSNLSAYKMRGSNKIIVRTKGGPSRNKIRTDPAYINTRKNNKEFGGRSVAGKWIRRVLMPVQSMGDYNTTGPLIRLLKPVQVLDTVSDWGKRNVCLTKDPHILEGFNINKRSLFDSVVRAPITCTLSKETLSASVHIPGQMRGFNFFAPDNYPYYGFTVAFGLVPDLFLNSYNVYKPVSNYDDFYPAIKETEWLPTNANGPVMDLELTLPYPAPDEFFSLILCVGVRLGIPVEGNIIQQVKYVGSGKVVRAV